MLSKENSKKVKQFMVSKVGSPVAIAVVRMLQPCYRYRYTGLEHVKAARELGDHDNFILGVWHQVLLSTILANVSNPYPHVVMVSRSFTADPIANVLINLGFTPVRGSSAKHRRNRVVKKGGQEAKEEMIQAMKAGSNAALAVDGPTGPAKKVKAGIVSAALESGATILPIQVVMDRYWSFNSWDKFRFPKFFSKNIICYGKPIKVTPESDFEEVKAELESTLKDIESQSNSIIADWDKHSRKNWYDL